MISRNGLAGTKADKPVDPVKLYGTLDRTRQGSPYPRLRRCAIPNEQLQFVAIRVGKSAIQETLGYYDPDTYPIRNANTNAGLRFLGYNVN